MTPFSTFHQAIEDWIDRLADIPARVRRRLVPADALRGGGRGVSIINENPAWTADDRAKVHAAAAYEPGGVWTIGTNFNALPVGCQDCGHANWDGDTVTCGWEVTPRESKVVYPYGNGPSYEKRLAQAVAWEEKWKHTHPEAFLAYCRSKGAVDANGHIDTDVIYRQCSKADPIEEDE